MSQNGRTHFGTLYIKELKNGPIFLLAEIPLEYRRLMLHERMNVLFGFYL